MTIPRPPRKRKPWTARRIHLWVSILLALPMLIIAGSGILIAMRSVSDVKVPMRWLGAESVPERLPINAYLAMPDGTVYIGNAQGLNRITGGTVEPIAHFAGQEIIGLAAIAGRSSPIVATRMAVWRDGDDGWQPARRGRVRQLSTLPDGRVLAIAGGRGEMADGMPWVTADGASFQPYRPAMMANQTLPPLDDPKIALHQLMREIHAGAFFFGKGPGEMIWSNVFGWVLVLLVLTGLWMWLKTERRKADQRAMVRETPAPTTAPRRPATKPQEA